MAGLGSALDIARTALSTQSILIQTASQNIANADNANYSRQTASVVTNPATHVSGGWVGNGTTVAKISQIRDAYVDKQLLASVSQQADYQAQSTALGPVASFLEDDGNSGLTQQLGAFWDAWDSLSQNPTGTGEQQNVVNSAQNLATGIQSAYQELSKQADDLKGQISDTVDKVNTQLQNIATLNQQITSAEGNGQTANDLRDLRYQAMKELSGYIGVSYNEETDGSWTVSVADGTSSYELVAGSQYGELQADNTTAGGTADPVIQYTEAGSTTPTTLTSNDLSGGSLSGMLTTWHNAFSTSATPPSYMSKLDTFAANLIDQVNTAYNPSQTDPTLNVFDGSGASSIGVNSNFSTSITTVTNATAVTVANLQNTNQSTLDDKTFGQYLTGIQQQIALDQQSAASQEDFQTSLLSQLQSQQQTVSGVNMDEEMVNLIKFQQVYQAAAKVISTTRDLLDTLMQLV